MKNSKEYAQKVQKLYRSLKRTSGKTSDVTYEEPADAIIYAALSENMSDSAAQDAIKKFNDYFTDWNDLRVSRIEEIAEVLGGQTPISRQIATALNRTLAAIFNSYHAVSLKALEKMGKRPAKQILDTLDGASHFVVNYCMLTSLQGHAIPLTKNMIEYLRSNRLVDADADEQEIEGFLTRLISASNAYEFYALLRQESEMTEAGKGKKTTQRAKTIK